MARRHTGRVWISSAAVVSVLAAAFLLGGLAYGTYSALGGSAGFALAENAHATGRQPASQSASGKKLIHVVGLGDSLAHGLGDASGRGFVGDIVQMYRQHGRATLQSNLGIDGLTASGLQAEIQQPAVQQTIRSATLILLSIGGNDLRDNAGLPHIRMNRIARAERGFSAHLTAIMTTISHLNPAAVIVLMGLYNPYGDIPGARRQTDAIVQNWNAAEEAVAWRFPHAIVAQTFDLFSLHPAAFLYIDHFHPNQAGYQRIAQRIWQDLQD